MPKLTERYGAQSQAITTTGKERPVGDPKSITALTVNRQRIMDELEQAKARIAELEAAGESAREIPLADLHEVPGRKRKLTDEQFNELVENLRNNPLVTPITVRTRAEGGFEIISGHNRFAAYRLLGRESIPGWVLESDEVQADLNAFYANLLQPSLPEYEKYRGFKKRLEITGKTQLDIAKEAGVSPSYVSVLMQFDDLPEDVLSILDDHPSLIGTSAAKELGALAKAGNMIKVLQAVDDILTGKLSQAAAIRAAVQAPTEKKPKAGAKKFRVGRTVVAEMRAVDKVLRISFRSAEEREKIEAAIEDVLKSYADQAKAGGGAIE